MAEPRSSTPQRELNRLIRENRVGDYHSANLALGMRPLEFAPGSSLWIWDNPDEKVLNPFGAVAGGYLGVLVDEILSTAIGSVLEDDEWAVTVEIKLSYLRPVRSERMEGRGRVIRRTRTVAFMEAEIRNANGEAAVLASSTWVISRLNP
jgi:uncharacterized protein (TIGR00369 family)